jgi:hypothetical protein
MAQERKTMGTLYVARSPALSKWASDVGLSKHIYKIGYTDEPVKSVIEQGWAGESDWTLVKKQEGEGVDEAAFIERLAQKEKMVDPKLYPRIRGASGIFKVAPAHVENHIVVARALAGEGELTAVKLKPADFAAYLLHNAVSHNAGR